MTKIMTKKNENKKNIKINVPVLARVEGEGALEIDIIDEQIIYLKLKIFEPPRLFEKLLEGKSYTEVPDIVARICGICPVAYQMSAVHAFERLFEVDPGPWVKSMRRLFYCAEWIESHSLHIHLLAAPDFLGYESAPAMAKDYPFELRRGITLQNLGNEMLRFLGGRSVHPVGVKVGGFYRAPEKQQAESLLSKLVEALPQAEALVQWVASFKLPEFENVETMVALNSVTEYPMSEGCISSSDGLKIDSSLFTQHFVEHHQPHSTALHCLHKEKPYLVGPLSRVNLNFDQLPDVVKDSARKASLHFPSKNMFHSIHARALEVLFAINESITILSKYYIPESSFVDVTPKAGIASACTEAPRGILFHEYEVDEQGKIMKATIVPPTSQNQARMEQDLRRSLNSFGLDRSEQELRLHAEKIIRNYDPCISCATHFLNLKVNRH